MIEVELDIETVNDCISAGIAVNILVKENGNEKKIDVLISKEFLEELKSDEVARLSNFSKDNNRDALIKAQENMSLKDILHNNMACIEATIAEKLQQVSNNQLNLAKYHLTLDKTDSDIFRRLTPR